MKKIYYSLLLSLACGFCNAQNLVPNGDFEQYSTCPHIGGQINLAIPWFNPSLGGVDPATPDYFNQCAPIGNAHIPNNYYGYQIPHSGVAYSGIVLWHGFWTFREYIEVPLIQNLDSGICYHFRMYVNVADYMQYATSDLGVYFSNTIITIAGHANLPYTPQITNMLGFIADSINWVLFEGDYTASGGETHLVIGNFNDDINTDTMTINNNGALHYAYVYIDDVSLTPCAVGINAPNPNGIQIYPNPFSTTLSIQLDDYEPSEIILRDITAREIMREKFTNAMTINTEGLAKGMYIYEVIGRDGFKKSGKIVKE